MRWGLELLSSQFDVYWCDWYRVSRTRLEAPEGKDCLFSPPFYPGALTQQVPVNKCECVNARLRALARNTEVPDA